MRITLIIIIWSLIFFIFVLKLFIWFVTHKFTWLSLQKFQKTFLKNRFYNFLIKNVFFNEIINLFKLMKILNDLTKKEWKKTLDFDFLLSVFIAIVLFEVYQYLYGYTSNFRWCQFIFCFFFLFYILVLIKIKYLIKEQIIFDIFKKRKNLQIVTFELLNQTYSYNSLRFVSVWVFLVRTVLFFIYFISIFELLLLFGFSFYYYLYFRYIMLSFLQDFFVELTTYFTSWF